MTTSNQIREPVVSGAFYPAEPDKIIKTIQDYFKKCSAPQIEGEIVGLIAPHAGYVFSGQAAAEAFKQIEHKPYNTVVVIAPSHFDHISGISVYDGKAYKTPLGEIPVDNELTRNLIMQGRFFHASTLGHQQEHSLEVQLPFLQYALDDFSLVPIAISDLDWEICEDLANALNTIIKNRSTLIVASSDLSHYHSDKQARILDQIIIDSVKKNDPEGLYQALRNRSCEACGGAAIVSMMLTTRLMGAMNSTVLRYMTSGDVSLDRYQVVGYLSAAFWK